MVFRPTRPVGGTCQQLSTAQNAGAVEIDASRVPPRPDSPRTPRAVRRRVTTRCQLGVTTSDRSLTAWPARIGTQLSGRSVVTITPSFARASRNRGSCTIASDRTSCRTTTAWSSSSISRHAMSTQPIGSSRVARKRSSTQQHRVAVPGELVACCAAEEVGTELATAPERPEPRLAPGGSRIAQQCVHVGDFASSVSHGRQVAERGGPVREGVVREEVPLVEDACDESRLRRPCGAGSQRHRTTPRRHGRPVRRAREVTRRRSARCRT